MQILSDLGYKMLTQVQAGDLSASIGSTFNTQSDGMNQRFDCLRIRYNQLWLIT